MTTTLDTTVHTSGRTAGAAGLLLTALGVFAAFGPDAGGIWFALAAVAILLFVGGITGLRKAVADVTTARRALAVVAVTMTLFGLSHLYAIVDPDRATPLFSALMVLSAVGLIVAGVAILRARIWSGPGRFLPLLCGVWPLATIPVGAAVGDVPHFLAIALWGVSWIGLSRLLLTTPVRA
ncbi:hypothetical protein AB0L70_16755 [Kribbella sp. NPDC051952]|uniref:hypothetical protein n=1 Tax=Kribbella sp. NPDC051952 TaxID=3154851 RepID=UPI0034486638